MSLHSIFSFHGAAKSTAPPQAEENDPLREVVSETWQATTETLRASLSLEEQLGSSVEMT